MPMPLSPLTRQMIARKGAYAQHAKYDVREITSKARQVFRESFAEAVRVDHPELDEEEVQRRGDALRRAWYADLAIKSAKSRARRKARKDARLNKLPAPGPLPDRPASGGSLTVSDGDRAGDGSGPEQHAEAGEAL